jgi:nitrilase
LDEHTIDEVAQGNSDVRNILSSAPPSVSMILGPQGEPLADPRVGGQGIVVADIDIALSIEQKQFHDIVGYYNRFDVFRLILDQRRQSPISVISGTTEEGDRDRPSLEQSLAPVVKEDNQEQPQWRRTRS